MQNELDIMRKVVNVQASSDRPSPMSRQPTDRLATEHTLSSNRLLQQEQLSDNSPMYSPILRNENKRQEAQHQQPIPKDYSIRLRENDATNHNDSINNSMYSNKYEQIYEKQVASLQKQKQSLYDEWGRDKQQFRDMQRILQSENEALRAQIRLKDQDIERWKKQLQEKENNMDDQDQSEVFELRRQLEMQKFKSEEIERQKKRNEEQFEQIKQQMAEYNEQLKEELLRSQQLVIEMEKKLESQARASKMQIKQMRRELNELRENPYPDQRKRTGLLQHSQLRQRTDQSFSNISHISQRSGKSQKRPEGRANSRNNNRSHSMLSKKSSAGNSIGGQRLLRNCVSFENQEAQQRHDLQERSRNEGCKNDLGTKYPTYQRCQQPSRDRSRKSTRDRKSSKGGSKYRPISAPKQAKRSITPKSQSRKAHDKNLNNFKSHQMKKQNHRVLSTQYSKKVLNSIRSVPGYPLQASIQSEDKMNGQPQNAMIKQSTS